MRAGGQFRRTCLRVAAIVCGMALVLSVRLQRTYGESIIMKPSPPNVLRLGERMYRQGILPSGEPMLAYVKGDLPVSGTAFSCESCHQRSGLGCLEGGVYTLPTNGAKLFQPYQEFFKNIEQKYFPPAPRRPAYTDATLAEVIRSGTTPTGAALNDVMPRYLLEDEDMTILLSYLRSLSARFSPGVTNTTLRFATILAEDVPAEERDALLGPLEQYITLKNNQSIAYKTKSGARSRQMAENMLTSKELATRSLTLSRWILKGPPETWRAQLEEYYRNEPVFAFLGGISRNEWLPMHQFSEENHIPCLLPLTDFPVISENDWYTLYPSKGYYQEGEAAARYLNSRNDLTMERPILQIVRDSKEGKALSTGFENTWRDIGRPAPIKVSINAGEHITTTFLNQLLEREKPAAILLWDGHETLPVLEMAAGIKDKPEIIIVSSRYLGARFREIPDIARHVTYITYPFAFAQKTIRTSMGSTTVPDDTKMSVNLASVPVFEKTDRITSMSKTITQLATMSLMDMGGNYYSDNFFDVMSMLADQPSAVFGRLSFGPGQRYASKGCYIVQLTKGPNPEMVRKSDWVIH